MTTVVGLGGSRRGDSVSAAALERALAAASQDGVAVDPWPVAELDLPVFDPERPDRGDAPALRDAVRSADGLLVASPMYHGSYAAPVKNAVDHLRVEDVEDAVVGLIAVAGGGFPRAALDHLRAVMRALGAWTAPQDVAVPYSEDAVDGDGGIDGDAGTRIDELARTVAREANRTRGPAATRPPG